MTSEHKIQTRIRNHVADRCHVFRVNVGTGWTGDARRLANGNVLIANPRPLSSGLPVGFADLVGWQTVTVTEDMVGTEIARFIALEVKSPTGTPTTQQLAFLAAVQKAGGVSGIVRSEADADRLLSPGLTMTPANRMTAEQFVEACEELGLSSVDLAKKLGVAPRTIANWRSGAVPVPSPVALLMPYLIESAKAR